jgi:Cu/Ag efflux protein CusF
MRPFAATALFLLLASCQQSPITSTAKEDAKDEPVRRYALHGEVLRLDSQGKIAAIKHQKIGDWMEAMTMEFPVKEQSEFDKLQPGEKINATVFVQGNSYWVGEIQEDATPVPASK